MTISSFFKSLTHLSTSRVMPVVLTAAEQVVHDFLPEFGDQLAAFSQTLPTEFTSLLALANHAKDLIAQAKNIHLSTSLALHLAQTVITAHRADIIAEAEQLLSVKAPA